MAAVCRRRVARHQTLNISRVYFGERLIPHEQHIFRIAHGMIGQIEAPCHNSIVRDDKLIVHEVVWLRLILTIKGD